ncbi:hypothetical protein BO78DRAFT_381516 [Aspergillus sclerotiicarbonarius CBS 121057]|uniref:Uncharacterized protein n=1 Tax=Aspergillus sclerotiicarbonarius (strain CBS 121057 / IBT 28362) TaxID=1448318 RepID=A0A319EVC9_ASPSB|nr:hypothetical protein BO78DRAFT_381516 [Aspergillus sclerotiicarbonarius CBS 121057]
MPKSRHLFTALMQSSRGVILPEQGWDPIHGCWVLRKERYKIRAISACFIAWFVVPGRFSSGCVSSTLIDFHYLVNTLEPAIVDSALLESDPSTPAFLNSSNTQVS